jgi:nitrite reductase/ring-hydroxylating ferredoxin subunit/DMSO/TMAO reductase YedYZ heme-binding membrane subunit
MSVRYVAVTWNRQKRIYDAALAAGVVGSIATFGGVTAVSHPDATIESILIRGIGLTGFVLLHFILMIGPLARLDRRFLPLLYNRRHLGVTLGLLGLTHAGLVIFQYHALGNLNPLESLLVANQDWNRIADFPFEWFGVLALVILLLMAATSHDFWLSVLTPRAWKRLHMLVYLAYVALIAHVGLGFLQDERHPIYVVAIGLGVLVISGLHLAAAARERGLDDPAPSLRQSGDWVDIAGTGDIAEGRAVIGLVGDERVAVFRHEDRLSAVSNVCKHQNGPLGEGRIIDGCITCPWHGYQYRPDTGTSPPPFNDRIATYRLRIESGRVLVGRLPNLPGTYVEPVPCGPAVDPVPAQPFYVGYQPVAPAELGRFTRWAVVTVLLLAGATLGAFALAQRTFEPATFQYGRATTVEGTIRALPYPVLEVRDAERVERVSSYLLAAGGKHGAQAAAASTDGRRVRIAGFLASRDRLRLLEIASVAPTGDSVEAAPPPAPTDLGTFDLEGEIVDSKCYAGVMNPGHGKMHRGCAARCLSGGLTPIFVTTGAAGNTLELVVVDEAMGPVRGIDSIAGKKVRLTGRVWRQGDLWWLQLASR